MLLALGVLGSVASIISLFLPASTRRQRVIHAIYCVLIIILAYITFNYQKKLDRVANIERVATKMVEDHTMNYTDLGYVQATLAFLEKNKDLYPDTYKRALDMCTAYRCSEPQSTDMGSLAFAMKGLLRGLATIDSDS